MSQNKYTGHRITITIPFDVYDELVTQANSQDRPVANYCRNIVIKAVNDKSKEQTDD
ncbi:hypothetical protein CAL7716_053400 [Calothrix sp. PCC 7716]|nr:hypothetical protein CAL7716_053400 [Calothrix sp. PCC 7716]